MSRHADRRAHDGRPGWQWVAAALVASLAWLWLSVVEAQGATPGLEDADRAYARGDIAEAIRLYREAADRDDPAAQVKLGFIYDNAEENEEAARWYERAVRLGDADGHYWLGRLYLAGEGVGRDIAKGVQLLDAAARVVLLANVMLARAYETGDMGVAPDPARAWTHWRRAADLGERSAMARLVTAYRRGELGQTIDEKEAARWDSRARGEHAGE